VKKLKLSTLPKTWLIDVDGVVFFHNNYKRTGKDKLIKEFKLFTNQISENDYIVLLTSRKKKYEKLTKGSLKKFKIRYDKIIFEVPKGERILINDIKPRGLITAHAINIKRNSFPKYTIEIDENL